MSEVAYLVRYEFRKTVHSSFLGVISLALLILCNIFPNQTIPPICIFLATTSMYLTDNFHGYMELIASMPVRKSSVVFARYLHSFIITLIVSVVPLLNPNSDYRTIFPFMFMVLSLYVSCNLPLVMISSKYANIVCVFGYLLMLGVTGTFTGIAQLLGMDNFEVGIGMSVVHSMGISLIFWVSSVIVSLILLAGTYAKQEGR